MAIKVVASDQEHKLITTNPQELLKLRKEGILKSAEPKKPTYKPMKRYDMDKYETLPPVAPKPAPIHELEPSEKPKATTIIEQMNTLQQPPKEGVIDLKPAQSQPPATPPSPPQQSPQVPPTPQASPSQDLV